MKRTSSLWADLPRRLATICIGVPILWTVCSHILLRHLFFQGTHLVMCCEWVILTKQPVVGRWLFPVISLALANIQEDSLFHAFLVAAVALCSLLQSSPTPESLLAVAIGFVLLTIPNRAWLLVSQSFHPTVSLLLTTWNCDTGALLAGRLSRMLGRTNHVTPPWLHRISPAKSVEGLLGGLIAGTLTYTTLPYFWRWIDGYSLAPAGSDESIQTELDQRLLSGLLLSTAAVLGDLWESSLKRIFGVKDSGRLLPGHGGVLDRFDSSLVAVLVYQYLLEH